jgi:hypothetical protein
MDSDAKELGHERAANRKTVWASLERVVTHSQVGNRSPTRERPVVGRDRAGRACNVLCRDSKHRAACDLTARAVSFAEAAHLGGSITPAI